MYKPMCTRTLTNIVCFLISIVSFSCQKEEINPLPQTVLNRQEVHLKAGESVTLYYTSKHISETYQWELDQESLVTMDSVVGDSLYITADAPGMAKIYLRDVQQQKIIDSCSIYIAKANIIRVLAIGNSFSEDALEYHLAPLFQAIDREYVIGNLYIGGADLDLHLQNVNQNRKNYSYRKIAYNQSKKVLENTSIADAILDENWDYISFQQASPKSGLPETYTLPLPALLKAVKEINTFSGTQYILHQTWAYAPNHIEWNFINKFNSSQIDMYQGICKSYAYAQELTKIKTVIPVGTAIQNARATILGNNLTRDGYHLDPHIGRYIAACTWYVKLTNSSALKNKYEPAFLSSEQRKLAQIAANLAVKTPYKVSEIN